MTTTAPVRRAYLRRRADGQCAVEGCTEPAYRAYARCQHHRYLRDHYGTDQHPAVSEPEHGTLARYRGNKSRLPCNCDDCKEANAAAKRAWIQRQEPAAQPRRRGKLTPEHDAELRQLRADGMTLAALAALPRDVHGPLAWQDQALCREVDAGELFFPERGGTTAPAKSICRACPVREQCLTYALDNDERFGIWGGLSESERRRLKRSVA